MRNFENQYEQSAYIFAYVDTTVGVGLTKLVSALLNQTKISIVSL